MSSISVMGETDVTVLFFAHVPPITEMLDKTDYDHHSFSHLLSPVFVSNEGEREKSKRTKNGNEKEKDLLIGVPNGALAGVTPPSRSGRTSTG